MNYYSTNLGERDFSVLLTSNGIEIIDHANTFDSFESIRDIKITDLNFERSIALNLYEEAYTKPAQAPLIEDECSYAVDLSTIDWDAAIQLLSCKIQEVNLSLSGVKL